MLRSQEYPQNNTDSTQKAITAATEKFSLSKATHIVRLTCNAADMPYVGNYAGVSEVFMWVE